jgi:L-asparaginase
VRRRLLPRFPTTAVEDVFLVTAVTGMDGTLVRALASRRPAGLVVAATGSGNTHPDLLLAATELMADGTVVVLTTRSPTGMVVPLYAFPGGGATWQRDGAILSAFDGPKSRVALALGLSAGLDRSALIELIGQ